jgi:hypothetical protein
MNYLTADDLLLQRLQGIVDPVEIRDPSGKLLGHYTPVLSPEEEEAYARAAQLVDLEEMKRLAETEQQGYSIEQVKEHLRSLEQAK